MKVLQGIGRVGHEIAKLRKIPDTSKQRARIEKGGKFV